MCVPVWNGPGCVTAHDLHIPVIAAQTWTLILRVCRSSRCAMKANLAAAPFSQLDRYSTRCMENNLSSSLCAKYEIIPCKKLKATPYPPGSTQIRGVVTVKNHQTLTSTACGNSRQCCGKCGSLFKQLPPEKRRHLRSLLAMDRPSKVSSPSSENRVKVWKI